MKLSTILLTALLCGSASAWVMKDLRKAASIAFATAAISTACPLAVHAAIDFSGNYADPNHPNCQRLIEQDSKGVIKLTGTDGNPGCPADGSGKSFVLFGRMQQGDRILVDFSPKGGPKDLEGIFDGNAPTGIKWPDGNKWVLKGKVVDSIDLSTDNLL